MTQHEDEIIDCALSILELRLKSRAVFSDPDEVKSFLQLQTRGLAQEIFAVMYLDGDGRLIDYERHASVDPAKIVTQALTKKAPSVIVHHNHADGCCWPSVSDCEQALRVAEALAVVGTSVLDHVITSEQGFFSVVERGFKICPSPVKVPAS